MDAVLMMTLWQTWAHNISEDIENDESDGLPCLLLVQSLHQFVKPPVSGGMQVGGLLVGG